MCILAFSARPETNYPTHRAHLSIQRSLHVHQGLPKANAVDLRRKTTERTCKLIMHGHARCETLQASWAT